MKKEPKMICELYTQFEKQFGVNEIANSQSLTTLYGYLAIQMKRCNGKFYHIPSDYLCVLIKTHLQYDPTAADELYEAAKTEKHDCRLCNWVETCSYIEYGLTGEIDTCKSFKQTRVLS